MRSASSALRATVTVTSLSGNVSRSARTDKNGRYTVTFPGDEGDYFVNIAALGFATKRFEVKRTGDQEILVADARLPTEHGAFRCLAYVSDADIMAMAQRRDSGAGPTRQIPSW